MKNKCFWRHLVDLEVDLGAHWILKGSQNLSFLYKINKKGIQEGVLKKHDFWMDFQCQNGRPWGATTSISHYTCCKLKGFARSWQLMKNVYQKISQIIQKHSRGRSRDYFLWFLWTCLGAPICFLLLGSPKRRRQIHEKHLFPQKEPKTDTRGRSISYGGLLVILLIAGTGTATAT